MFNVKNNLQYNLRNNECDYISEKPKTNFFKKSIGYSGVKTWNELPSELKHKGISLQRFKALFRDSPT